MKVLSRSDVTTYLAFNILLAGLSLLSLLFTTIIRKDYLRSYLSCLVLCTPLFLLLGVIIFCISRSRQRKPDSTRQGKNSLGDPGPVFRQLAEVTNEGFWFLKYTPERVAFFNPSMERMWGMKGEEFASDPSQIYDRIHPEDRERIRKRLMALVKQDTLGSFRDEFRILQQDGTIRWVRSESTGFKMDQEHFIWTAGIMEDVTERVELQESLKHRLRELHASEQRYMSLFENAPVSLLEKDFSGIKARLDQLKEDGIRDLKGYLLAHPEELIHLVKSGKALSANKAAVDLLGVDSDRELLGDLESTCTRDTLHAYSETVQSVWDGRVSLETETRYTTPTGEEKQMIVKWVVVPGHERDYSRILVSASDITQLRLYQDQLLRSERLFETFMENLPAVAWIKDENLRFKYANMYFETKVVNGADILGRTDFEIWPQSTAEKMRTHDLTVMRSRTPLTTLLKLELADGQAVHYSVTKFPIIDSSGDISVGGIGFDISDRLGIENQLKKSRELYRELVETIDEIVFSLDENGFLTYISPFSAESFGLTPEEITGAHYSVLVHPDDLAMVTDRFIGAKHGIHDSFECRFVVGDGTTRWGTVHGKPVVHEGQFTGVYGVILEISQRKKAELRAVELSEQLRAFASRLQTAREEERASVAREIHDEMGQKMTRLKIGLSLVRDDLTRHGSSKSVLEDVKELERSLTLVDGLMDDVRRIATNLRSEELDELGLIDAMNRFVDQYSRQSGLKCRFHAGARRMELGKAKSTALFRIFQEAMTNVVKHAQADQVEIRLSKYKGKVMLQVSDNGCGFDEHEYEGKKGLGILGMRERAISVGGSFSISRIDSGGTLVQVEVDA